MSQNDLDVALLRAETPAAEDFAFFNNAGASLPPNRVVDRVVAHLRREQQIGGYEAEAEAAEELDAVYTVVARLLNARPDEIALVQSATHAWDMAFYSLHFSPGDVILTAANEYASNYIALLQMAERTGARIEVVASGANGSIDLEALEGVLRESGPRAKLISLTHIATNGGPIQPAAEVGALARRYGVPYLLDACQSAGQLPLDVETLGCDMLSATGRKYLRAPRGTGFLYVRRGFLDRLEPPFLDMRAADWVAHERYVMRPDAQRFESWESSIAGRLGLGVAVNYALELGIDRVAARIALLGERLRIELAQIEGVTVTDQGGPHSGIVTFIHARLSAAEIVAALAQQKIVTRVSPALATRLDMDARGLDAVVRASLHCYNTDEETERLCRAVAAL